MRATTWYVGLLAVALVVFSAAVYAGIRTYLNLGLQRSLSSTVETIDSQFLSKLGTKTDQWVLGELRESYESTANDRYIRVSEAGRVLYSTGDMSGPIIRANEIPLPGAETAAFHRHRIQGQWVMTYSAPYRASGGRLLEVECGTSLFAMQQTLISLARVLIGATLAILLLAVVGGYFLMTLPLRPLVVLTENAESIGRKEMGKRLPVIPTGDELERLTHSLNKMIDRMEEALAHNYRFSADASHELRTPLTILRGEMEEMLLLEDLPSEAVENLVSSIEEVDRMSQIVNSLMAITRLDAGGERMDKRVLDLSELARTTVEHMRLLAEEKAVVLTISSPGKVFVEADPMRMKQVLVNLLDNAIKYTPAGPAASEEARSEEQHRAVSGRMGEEGISITVRASGSYALLQIRDHGIGILPEALPHVFDRFYRADYARTRVTGGVGLGLAIVKAIITAHDGTVSIESTMEEGTTVTVRLPLVPCPTGMEPTVSPEPAAPARQTTELTQA
jgi:signal transduction histidine kinase